MKAAQLMAMAAVAGLAIGSSAFGQVQPERASRKAVPLAYAKPVYIKSLDRKTVIHNPTLGGSDTQTPVWVNVSGGLFSSTAVPNWGLDDIAFTPGPGMGGGNMTAMFPGFVIPTTSTTMDVDVEIVYYDVLTPNASPFNTVPIDGFVLGFVGLAPGFLYTTPEIVDLTGLFPGGLPFPDDDCGAQYRFLIPGTNNLVASGQVTLGFAGGGVAPGFSDDVYWRDSNLNGIIDDPTDARFFGGAPNLANFYGEMHFEIDSGGCGCVCNYDTSTGADVCDFFDFIIFQDLFGASDPCGCELDTSTGTGVCDFFDFIIFQDLFSVGC